MSFIEKLLELLPLTKEHWIAILLAIIISGAIGGWLYINSLQNRIKSLEFQIQQQRESNKDFFEQYEKFHSEQMEQMKKQFEKVEEEAKVRIQAEYYKDLYISKIKNNCC